MQAFLVEGPCGKKLILFHPDGVQAPESQRLHLGLKQVHGGVSEDKDMRRELFSETQRRNNGSYKKLEKETIKLVNHERLN